MKINQRSREELAQALQKVQHALGLRPTKAAIVSALADMHWCSVNSSGIERTFLAAVKAAGLAVDGPFAKRPSAFMLRMVFDFHLTTSFGDDVGLTLSQLDHSIGWPT